jgi:hypothetical protein
VTHIGWQGILGSDTCDMTSRRARVKPVAHRQATGRRYSNFLTSLCKSSYNRQTVLETHHSLFLRGFSRFHSGFGITSPDFLLTRTRVPSSR